MADLQRIRGWRAKLEATGGWDNELASVPAGGVRSIIEDAEEAAAEIERLRGENEVLKANLAYMLSWVDGLPVKHPQQAERREKARAILVQFASEAVKDYGRIATKQITSIT